MPAIKKAVDIAGSPARLGELVGVTRQAVEQWLAKGVPPADRVLAIEAATERRVTRYELRPDIYPRGA